MSGIFAVGRVRRVLLLTVLACAASPVGSALADTTIGQTGATGQCGFGRAVLADSHYVVPAGGGTITSFSFQATTADSGQQLDFLVLGPTATSGSYTVVGKTGVVTVAGMGAEPETFQPSPAIDVQGGDILGLWTASPLASCFRFVPGGGLLVTTPGAGDPSVGDSLALSAPFPNQDLNESANFVPALPTSKDQCKNGGWQSFGTRFKNQGDCVSFVATGGKNQPSGS